MSTVAPSPAYTAAIAHLNTLIPELFTAPGPASGPAGASAGRRKFSLDQIAILSQALGNPHRRFPSVLIAGTNGKGSTASTLASIARTAGLRVGLYTSPHLERVNERIRLGQPGPDGHILEIPDETFAQLYFRVLDTARQLVLDGQLPAPPPGSPKTGPGSWSGPSYFELLTALAFLYFAEPTPGSGPVDLAILEVGMGGRLDATNIVTPILSVITDIALDHQEWLGSTIPEIAREKAGILRPNGTLITLPQHPEANQALGEVAVALDVRAINAASYTPPINTGPATPYPLEIMGQSVLIDSPLHGAHQHRNLALAIAAAVELAERHNLPITPAAIAEGIRATQWPGRLETIHIPGAPKFILDVAHNPAGAWALRAALNMPDSHTPDSPEAVKGAQDSRPSGKCLIFACLRDKPLREMTQILFPIFDHVVLAPIHSPRATEVADLLAAAQATGVPSTPSTTVEEAIQIAENLNPATIVISGSLYLVGEARTLLLNRKAPQS